MEKLTKGDRRRGGRPRITEMQKDKVVQMYKSGMSIAQIMAGAGVGRSTVYRILRERTVDA